MGSGPIVTAIIGGIATVVGSALGTYFSLLIQKNSASDRTIAVGDPVAKFLSFAAIGLTITVGIILVIWIPRMLKTMEMTQQTLQAERLRPGMRFRDCDVCPELALVPAGYFEMGSERNSERPRHAVTIPKPFAVGVYEVTNSEWRACVDDGSCDSPYESGVYFEDNHPVIYVTWWDTKDYIEWLTDKAGVEYRLLSESEWEYVTRAGTKEDYYFGKAISTNQANFGRVAINDVPAIELVGSYDANSFGLYDTHGNVMEWVYDCWKKDYKEAPRDGSSVRSDACQYRVLRGGSWVNSMEQVRSAVRFKGEPNSKLAIYGLRVARDVH